MQICRSLLRRYCYASFALLLAFDALTHSPLLAYSPEDPEVQELVAGGIKHLEQALNSKTHYETGRHYYGGWGEKVLAGYAHYKVEQNAKNPVVVTGLEAAVNIAKGLAQPDPGGNITTTNYNAGVTAMLLAAVDQVKYRKELEQVAAYFKRAQLANGPYTYKGESGGDTSQTQYAMLALWTLEHAGVEIDYAGIVKTVAWLGRVQDVNGGWPYKGVDPGSGKGRIKQPTVSTSMALAGGSSVLIAGDILRLWGGSAIDDPKIDDLPKAVKLYKEKKNTVRRPAIPTDPILRAIEESDGFLAKNSSNPGKLVSEWPYYQLYTLERYESFKEIARTSEKSGTAWYDEGVEYLKKERNSDGGWSKGSHMTSSVSTAFAVLFLIRSTQKSIAQLSKGTLAGGYGLPSDTTKITVSGTQIKGEPSATSVEDLLSLLEADDPKQADSGSIPEDLKLQTEPKARQVQLDRLERLVRGSQSWQARRVAARLLGQSDELRVVPALIFALSDPDSKVKQYADDGLCFISRKFDGIGFPTQPNSEDIRRAQNFWRDWFLSIKPGYVFTDGEL